MPLTDEQEVSEAVDLHNGLSEQKASKTEGGCAVIRFESGEQFEAVHSSADLHGKCC